MIDLTSLKTKGCIILSFLLAFLVTTMSVNAAISDPDPQNPWKVYPYSPPGTNITFPSDEASHNQEYKIEWWYANLHLTGENTGKEYGSFVAFYLIQFDNAEDVEVRILSISDPAVEQTYTDLQLGTLEASTDHLDLAFTHLDEEDIDDITSNHLETTFHHTQEYITQTALQRNINSHSLLRRIRPSEPQPPNEVPDDRWYTKKDDQGNLLPFQYHLHIGGDDQIDGQQMQLSVDMDCLKKPLIVGGTGFVELDEGFSFYYSLTNLDVIGTITVDGVQEEVTGRAWIDHQWGNFAYEDSPPDPFGLLVTYEWFSIKLENDCEIMVGDIWDRPFGTFIDESFSNGINLVHPSGALELLEDYTITQLQYWTEPLTNHIFASQWHIYEPSKPIDIIVTPVYPDQMMYALPENPILQQLLSFILPGSLFWEGICTVSGYYQGQPITGKAFVELTHNYGYDLNE